MLHTFANDVGYGHLFADSLYVAVMTDHRDLTTNSEFLGIVLEMIWIQHDWINRIEVYRTISESVIPQLNQAIGDS